jgi:hypothetical protein
MASIDRPFQNSLNLSGRSSALFQVDPGFTDMWTGTSVSMAVFLKYNFYTGVICFSRF